MPVRPCLTRGCPNLTPRSRCEDCERTWERQRRRSPHLTGRRDRPTPEWLRRAVLRRSGFRCELCHAHQVELDRPLHVHHRNGLRSDNAMENLAALCETCHRQADRELGIWR